MMAGQPKLFRPRRRGQLAVKPGRCPDGSVRCRGVSLVEVLVVVGIVAVLAGLVLPAVMRAREASRRSVCASRLREVGHALHAVQSATGQFPMADERDMFLQTPRVTPLTVDLLPYLGREPTYDRYIAGEPVDAVVPAYLCPSDAASRRGRVRINTRFCTGRQPTWAIYYAADDRDAGPFFARNLSGLRPRDFADGLSHTAAASERIGGNGAAGGGVGSDVLQLDLPNPTAYESSAFWQRTCADPADRIRSVLFDPGSRFDALGYEHTLYNHVLTPNPDFRDCAVWGNADRIGAYAARSFHDGGVNLLAFDGAVSLVADSIDEAVWQARATVAGGELELQ